MPLKPSSPMVPQGRTKRKACASHCSFSARHERSFEMLRSAPQPLDSQCLMQCLFVAYLSCMYTHIYISIYMYIYIYIVYEPVHNMHEARWSEQKLMPRIEEREAHFSSGHFERKQRTHITAVGSSCTFRASGVARAAPVEHSAVPGWLERHPSSILLFRGRLERHPSSILLLRGRLDQHFSNILRLWGWLELPFRAVCGSGAGSSSHFEPAAAPEQARADICNK